MDAVSWDLTGSADRSARIPFGNFYPFCCAVFLARETMNRSSHAALLYTSDRGVLMGFRGRGCLILAGQCTREANQRPSSGAGQNKIYKPFEVTLVVPPPLNSFRCVPSLLSCLIPLSPQNQPCNTPLPSSPSPSHLRRSPPLPQDFSPSWCSGQAPDPRKTSATCRHRCTHRRHRSPTPRRCRRPRGAP